MNESMVQVFNDRQLSAAEIESITGIEASHPRAQANKLKREGIKHIVNARREVVVFLSWVQAAALPQIVVKSPARSDNDEDITLDFSSLRTPPSAQKKQRR